MYPAVPLARLLAAVFLLLSCSLLCNPPGAEAQLSQDIRDLFKFIRERSGDPCLMGTHNCSGNERCVSEFSDPFDTWQKPASGERFFCMQSVVCGPGMSIAQNSSGYIYCQDIEECLVSSHSCFQYRAHCINTEGSYRCVCNEGYVGDGRLVCDNVNECELGTHTCSESARCEDTMGSFKCQCASPGFLGDGHMECMDLDECQYGFHDCGASASAHVANCVNTFGSFHCQCGAGWTGSGKQCFDVDECSGDRACSGDHVACTNSLGSYTCQCASGYKDHRAATDGGEDLRCADIDECKGTSTDCSQQAQCLNTDGSYKCVCSAGYRGDGKTCVPESPAYHLSPWEQWSPCAFSCSPRQRRRTRKLLSPAPVGASCYLVEQGACPSLKCDYRYDYETQDYPGVVRDKSLVPIYIYTGFSAGDCEVTRWGPWSPCCTSPTRLSAAGASSGNVRSSRHRLAIRQPAYWGRPCPPLHEERQCTKMTLCKS